MSDGLRSCTPGQKGSCSLSKPLLAAQSETPRSLLQLNAIVLAMWFQTAPPEKRNMTRFCKKQSFLLAACTLYTMFYKGTANGGQWNLCAISPVW